MKKLVLIFLFIAPLALAQNTLLNAVKFKNIGPSVMSGRVVDIAINPSNPTEFYVAYASGGLWYTNNNGTSFIPVLDGAVTLNCGAVAVDWSSGTLWVGTGEVNASRSSYAGVGVLKSIDKGKTWLSIGLTDSHHIARIWFNPNNINELVVAVIGHLYTPNNERGIFKTTDGGNSWKKTLFVNDTTGVIDLTVSKLDPKTMYAATWEKDRKAWNFKGNGQHSGIYKSDDGGDNWKLLTTPAAGFPTGENIGRIGLCAVNSDTIYAVVDNQNLRLNTKVDNQNDANKAMTETNVIGCEVYKSVNGGALWVKQNKSFIDDLYYTYGYYFANIAVDPSNENRLYIGGVNLIFSEDGGATFNNISKSNVHSDHHFAWVNPKNSNHIINGNDGGVNITYDNGANWIKCNNLAVGQFYAVNIDNNDDYNVYGGLQDNGVWVGSHAYEPSPYWQQSGQYPYKEIMGGDGMQIQIDNRNSNIVFAGSQYGDYYKIDRATNKEQRITPKTKKDEEKLRFNWQTPILLSSHNQDILYLGSNFLHRSMNQGATWEKISPDLTNGKKEGNVAFGSITTISESTLVFGVLYAGTDDGKIQRSKDGGATWQLISNALPQNLWVSRIKASKFKKERVYATLNGYRNDDFNSYVFTSDDYGATWKNIASDKNSPANSILEDTENEAILYLGTDNGLQISVNQGKTWVDFLGNMPRVAVHDLVIQPKAKELIVGTHGRSLYSIALADVQLFTEQLLAKPLHVFEIKSTVKKENWGAKRNAWSTFFEPKLSIWYLSNVAVAATVSIKNSTGVIVLNQNITLDKNFNSMDVDLSVAPDVVKLLEKKDSKLKIKQAQNKKFYLPTGLYTLTIETNLKVSQTVPFEIIEGKKSDSSD